MKTGPAWDMDWLNRWPSLPFSARAKEVVAAAEAEWAGDEAAERLEGSPLHAERRNPTKIRKIALRRAIELHHCTNADSTRAG